LTEKGEKEMATNASREAVGLEEQYSLAKILGIWAAANLRSAALLTSNLSDRQGGS
jgi:hypothetical protein